MDDIKTNKQMDFGQKPIKEQSITWISPEFVRYPKTKNWYIVISIIGLVLAGLFVWLKNYMATAICILAPTVFFIMSREKIKKRTCTLDKNGLTIDEKIYSFDELKSFWIVDADLASTLYLETTRKFRAPITIYLAKVDQEKIRSFLSQFIAEQKGKQETSQDKISRIIGF